jgi:3-deoxy-manno-octulosonate cytidylyltransferase (CMP-KDO synthetase)
MSDTAPPVRVLGVIPARLQSTRLPRKPLRPICGRPMIAWVYERARQAAVLDGLLVATDAEEIYRYCTDARIPVMMTSPEHRSGTDRLVEVMGRHPAEIYVNIQGDEPMIAAEHLLLLLRPFLDCSATEVSTLKVAISPEQALHHSNVKVVTDLNGRALYFSRAMIPCERDGLGDVRYYKHLGLYAYTAAALAKFHTLSASPLEQIEKLEQLRFLENGIPIMVMETSQDTIGVDTEEDLLKVEAHFRERGETPPPA